MTKRVGRTKLAAHTEPARPRIDRARASKLCAALCCVALLVAPASARAQTAVRARRVENTPPSAQTPPTKKASRRNRKRNTVKARTAKANAAAKSSTKNTGNSSVSPAAQPAPSAASPDVTKDAVAVPDAAPLRPAEIDAAAIDDLDSARAARDAAKSDAERARLDRLYMERLLAESAPASALGELRSLLADERFDPPLYYNIGNALARLGDPESAATAYRKAIDQRRGDYPRALNNLGVVLLRTGDAAEAEASFLDAIRRENSAYPEAHYNLGRLYQARGESELAVRHLRRAVRYDPTNVSAALLLAPMLAADGDREEALKILRALRPIDEQERRRVADARARITVGGKSDDRKPGDGGTG